MIWIRADGGREIGTGHIMRCLSVAEALERLGEQVCFLVADDAAVPLLASRGKNYRILGSSWQEPEGELDTLLPMLREDGGVFLADSYYVTADYLSCVRELMPVCYMDDKGLAGLPVDLLINYNIFASRSLYGPDSGGTDYLLGTRYVPLRREFQDAYRPVRERAERVLITTGGSDQYDLAGRILENVLDRPVIKDLEYCVVSGLYNRHLPRLLELEKRHENVHIYENVTHMAQLMQSCDIAVTAGGSTMYELCAVGIPILCFSFVDNQEKIVEGFCEQKVVCFGGNFLVQGESMLDDISEQIALLKSNLTLRQESSQKERELVDGQGAARIAERLLDFLEK